MARRARSPANQARRPRHHAGHQPDPGAKGARWVTSPPRGLATCSTSASSIPRHRSLQRPVRTSRAAGRARDGDRNQGAAGPSRRRADCAGRSSGRGRDQHLAAAKPDAVAVCLIHSYANPAHERKVAQMVASACRAYVALSSEVWPEYPGVRAGLDHGDVGVRGTDASPITWASWRQELRQDGNRHVSLQIMQSNGGVMSAAAAARKAIYQRGVGTGGGSNRSGAIGPLCGRSQHDFV